MLIETDLRCSGDKTEERSSPGLAIFLNLQRTRMAERTSMPDWIPKKINERDAASAPNPIDTPPSAPLYMTLATLIAMAYC
jgi:hypothetical protein